ncbi:hypothetical protein AO259_25300 [Pseudomonas sp. ICMP 564]|nr:hypothetical protein AO259_25300 [Pseudomonas sp. ICMP 564]
MVAGHIWPNRIIHLKLFIARALFIHAIDLRFYNHQKIALANHFIIYINRLKNDILIRFVYLWQTDERIFCLLVLKQEHWRIQRGNNQILYRRTVHREYMCLAP